MSFLTPDASVVPGLPLRSKEPQSVHDVVHSYSYDERHVKVPKDHLLIISGKNRKIVNPTWHMSPLSMAGRVLLVVNFSTREFYRPFHG